MLAVALGCIGKSFHDLRKAILSDGFFSWWDYLIQQAMPELVSGATGLGRQVLEADSDQEGTGDVVALNPGLATLAAFQPYH